MFTIHWQPIAAAAAMMVIDIITGFAGAAMTHTIESGKMRKGLWHKAGFFGLILLSGMWEICAVYLDAEVSSIGISIPQLPAVGAVCAFIVATEIVSVLENLCILNPDIAQLPFVKSLKPHNPDEAELTVEIDDEEPRGAHSRS